MMTTLKKLRKYFGERQIVELKMCIRLYSFLYQFNDLIKTDITNKAAFCYSSGGCRTYGSSDRAIVFIDSNFECLDKFSHQQDHSFTKASFIAEYEALINTAITLTRVWLSVKL